jgi:hypothetical protein
MSISNKNSNKSTKKIKLPNNEVVIVTKTIQQGKPLFAKKLAEANEILSNATLLPHTGH